MERMGREQGLGFHRLGNFHFKIPKGCIKRIRVLGFRV